MKIDVRTLAAVAGVFALIAFAYNARDLAKWIRLERM